MDVRCTRCGTEYEFDDALISERGTSVRCTQCGYQFKVFPPQLAAVGPDEWIVLTSLGRRVVYRSLRELQAGISNSEIAREDLLARGSKPPRPLGSIAELEPLFASKSAQARNPSTLTGVAPPADGDDANSEGATRQAHSTFSGVAPPANLLESSAEPNAPAVATSSIPMRVGAGRTILGIGDSRSAVGSSSELSRASEEQQSLPESKPPNTLSYESRRGLRAAEATRRSEPPKNRPAASLAGSVSDASLAELADSLAAEAVTHGAVTDSERPRVASAPPVKDTDTGVPVRPANEAEPKARPATADRADTSVAEAAVARQSGGAGKPSSPASESTKAGHEEHTAVFELASLEPPTQKLGKSQERAPEAVQEKSPDKTLEKVKAAVSTISDDGATTPPTRVRPKSRPAKAAAAVQAATVKVAEETRENSQAPKPSSALLRLAVGAALLGFGVFAGMKLTGLQANPTPASGPLASSVAVAGVAPIPALPIQAPPATMPSGAPTLHDLLMVGDANAAEDRLVLVPASERDTESHRILRARVHDLSADLAWWRIQLIGKAGESYVAAKQQLAARLGPLKTDLAAIGSQANSTEELIAVQVNARRLQGDKSDIVDRAVADRLAQPSTDVLKYSKLVFAWTKAGVPDEATVAGLRELRLKPIDLGPRVVALVAALTQLRRFEEAKVELTALSAQARPHPLYSEMVGYVRAAEQTASGKQSGMSGDGADSSEADSDVINGDFRLRLTRANECLSRNETSRAQKLLRSVLAQRPNDTEALAAMADVSRRRGDPAHARELYDRVLALNAGYLPALSGAADLRWQAGDRAGAVQLYRRILERVGDSQGYGQVASTRVKEFDAAPKPPPAASSAPVGQDSRTEAPSRPAEVSGGSKDASKEQP